MGHCFKMHHFQNDKVLIYTAFQTQIMQDSDNATNRTDLWIIILLTFLLPYTTAV